MPSDETTRTDLAIIQMGSLSDLELRIVAANLQATLGINVRMQGSLEIPDDAFLENRRQYDAGLVLKHLCRHAVNQCRTLAVTDVDLCTPILTCVYGQAELGGRMALISSARLWDNPDRSRTSPSRYYERLAKVAIHEVAHTFSIYHCKTEKCVMQYSSNIRQLDDLDIWFCGQCEFTLRRTFAKCRVPGSPSSL